MSKERETDRKATTTTEESPRQPLERNESISPTRELTRVEEANYAFYEAFTARNVEAMEQLWSRTPYARCVHPGWDPVVGWHDIRQSWTDIFRTMQEIEFELADVHVEVTGSLAWINLVAFANVVTEDEEQFETSVIATTIFEKFEDRWLIVLHHASHYIEDELDEDGLTELESDLTGRHGSGTFEPN